MMTRIMLTLISLGVQLACLFGISLRAEDIWQVHVLIPFFIQVDLISSFQSIDCFTPLKQRLAGGCTMFSLGESQGEV
jgi:hypothetical protein